MRGAGLMVGLELVKDRASKVWSGGPKFAWAGWPECGVELAYLHVPAPVACEPAHPLRLPRLDWFLRLFCMLS